MKIINYIIKYWVSLVLFGLAFYFNTKPGITICGWAEPVTLFGMSEMTCMWIIMGLIHGINKK